MAIAWTNWAGISRVIIDDVSFFPPEIEKEPPMEDLGWHQVVDMVERQGIWVEAKPTDE